MVRPVPPVAIASRPPIAAGGGSASSVVSRQSSQARDSALAPAQVATTAGPGPLRATLFMASAAAVVLGGCLGGQKYSSLDEYQILKSAHGYSEVKIYVNSEVVYGPVSLNRECTANADDNSYVTKHGLFAEAMRWCLSRVAPISGKHHVVDSRGGSPIENDALNRDFLIQLAYKDPHRLNALMEKLIDPAGEFAEYHQAVATLESLQSSVMIADDERAMLQALQREIAAEDLETSGPKAVALTDSVEWKIFLRWLVSALAVLGAISGVLMWRPRPS